MAKKMDNPCWKGYKVYGTKTKDGKEVPNCVPENEEETMPTLKEMTNDLLFRVEPIKLVSESKMSEGLQYHIKNKISLTENIYRYGSEKYFTLINEVRELYNMGKLKLDPIDESILKTDIGESAIYEGEKVWLDIPYLTEAEYQGDEVELNQPKRGGSKKFYVYVKDGDTVKKISFGAKDGGSNLAVKLKDPEKRKDFAARHKCSTQNDKTSAAYWSCRLPRYAKSLGLSGGGQWW
jgi:hypothetical protein